MNKLVSTLFTEVTNLLGQEASQEETMDALRNSVDKNTAKISKIDETLEENSSVNQASQDQLEKLRESGVGLKRAGGIKAFISEQTETNKQQAEKIEELTATINAIKNGEIGITNLDQEGIASAG